MSSPTPLNTQLTTLLTSLTVGIRAASTIVSNSKSPNTKTPQNNNNDGDGDGGGGQQQPLSGEFDFNCSFPEFNKLKVQCSKKAKGLIVQGLELEDNNFSGVFGKHGLIGGGGGGVGVGGDSSGDDDDDDECNDYDLWENCIDTIDVLLEKVNDVVAVSSKRGDINKIAKVSEDRNTTNFQNSSSSRGESSNTKMKNLLNKSVSKSQVLYEFANEVNNTRDMPFKPAVHPEKPHALVPIDLELRDGSGLKDMKNMAVEEDDRIVPSSHYVHQYKTEISGLEYTKTQMLNTVYGCEDDERLGNNRSLFPVWDKKKEFNTPTPTDYTLVTTEDQLSELSDFLNDGKNGIQQLAVDLEAHSYRSFMGFTCLIQLSIPKKCTANTSKCMKSGIGNKTCYLIDALVLRKHINKYEK